MKVIAGILFACMLLFSLPASAVPFQLLLERDTDSGAGNEIFLVTYDSFADLLSNNIAANSFSQLDIAPAFSTGGLAAVVQAADVPEPSTLSIFGFALAAVGLMRRRRRPA